MRKILILCMTLVLVLILGTVAMAKVNLIYYTHTSIQVQGLEPGEYEQKLIDEFEKLYPNVNIDLEVIPYAGDQGKIELSIAAGSPPDILADDIPKLVTYVDAGLLLDFEEVLTAEEKAKFHDIAIKASTVHGKMYYYPMGVRVGSFMVNRNLARKLGVLDLVPINSEDRIWTTAEFEKFLAKVNEVAPDGTYGWCMNVADTGAWGHMVMHFVAGFGGEIFSLENGKYKCIVNSPEVKEGLEYYLRIYGKYKKAIPQGAENVTIIDLDNLWTSGHLVTCPGSVNQVIKERQGTLNVGFDLFLLPYPAKEGIMPGVPADWCGFMVFDTGDAERGKYAKLFVKYFVEHGEDITGANFNTSPVHKDIPIPKAFQQYKEDPEISYALNVETRFAKDLGNACPVMSQFRGLLQIHLQGVLIGAITVDECLQRVEDKTNLLLDEFYSE